MAELRKYPKYIKTHLFYLLSKRNLLVIVILNLFVLGYSLYIGNVFKDRTTIDAYREVFLNSFNNDYLFLIKIVFVCFTLFINISYFQGEYKEYSKYMIKSKKTRRTFYITKYVSILVFDFLELLFLFLVYESIITFMPYGRYPFLYLKSFLNLYLLSIVYTLLSSLFLVLIKTYLTTIFFLIFYWISLIYTSFYENLNGFIKIIVSIFPINEGNLFEFRYGVFHILIYITILIILNFSICFMKDD